MRLGKERLCQGLGAGVPPSRRSAVGCVMEPNGTPGHQRMGESPWLVGLPARCHLRDVTCVTPCEGAAASLRMDPSWTCSSAGSLG